MKIADKYKAKLRELTTLLSSTTNVSNNLKASINNKIKTCEIFLQDRGEVAVEKGIARDDAEFFMDGMDNAIEELEAHIAGGEVLDTYLKRKQERNAEEERRIEKAVEEEYEQASIDNGN